MTINKPARHIAMELLLRMEKDESYSNILLDHALDAVVDSKEKAFTTALFYGVLERKLTLDHIISEFSSTPLKKLSPEVLQILRVAIYQLMYMDYIPESAAVNEAVKLTQACKKTSAKGFVNAILRNFIRSGKKLSLDGLDRLQVLSVKYSCPLWLVRKLDKEYGKTEEILSASVGRPPLTIRVNTIKTTTDQLERKLQAQGVITSRSDKLTDCLFLDKSGAIEQMSEYKEGLFHVQDISSQQCCHVLSPQQGEIVLDLCSAPGGKSFTLAQLMNNKGKLSAYDLHSSKISLISDGAKRLGIDIIQASTSDASVHNPRILPADRILCDVPCSGFGIIRRKPEIKYKPKSAHEALPQLQLKILSNAASYLKKGGTLVYSTCTLSRAENDNVVDAFLAQNPHFSEQERQTLLPGEDFGDGFFISKLIRMNDNE